MNKLTATCISICVACLVIMAVVVLDDPTQPKSTRATTISTAPPIAATLEPGKRYAPAEAIYRQMKPARTRINRAGISYRGAIESLPKQRKGAPKPIADLPTGDRLVQLVAQPETNLKVFAYREAGLVVCQALVEPVGVACLATNLKTGKRWQTVALGRRESDEQLQARALSEAAARLPSQTLEANN